MANARVDLESECRVKAIFDEVADAPIEDRLRLMHERCGDDMALRQRVEALLAAHDAAENFLDPPPPLFGFSLGAASAPPASEGDDPLIGQHIARYRIVRRLAAGGMGVVYLAEQDQPRRQVALKLMRAGIASRSMLRRFEHEAEVLGQLRHPGIAQVFEAGTFDLGRGAQPYFAMEFIDGRRLTDFAEHHHLPTTSRLELLASVCDAVHHAHQKGVVHRDLKPDNILVEERDEEAGLRRDEETERRRDQVPTPGSRHTSSLRLSVSPSLSRIKILDFGVARLTDSDFAVTTLQTDLGQIVGTLPYMSPEQVAADPSQVDTRSDVYALGVIAYELLTGEVPLDVRHKSVAEAARIISDHEPPALTAFSRIFRGDISTIVAKALEKDKTRRYQSAWELGEDIRRFLRHEPITARPATTLYQLRKFARRNKALVSGVVGVVLMLVLGVVGTSIGLVRARESARIAQQQEQAAERSALEAQQQRAAAEQVSRFLQQMLASINPATALGRDTALLREILDQAALRVDRELAGQPDIAATLHGVIGRTYSSIAEYPQAIAHLQLALQLRVKTAGDESAEAARARGDLGRVLLAADRFADALPLLQSALDASLRLHGPAHPNTIGAMIDLANQRRRAGDYDGAERMLRDANSLAVESPQADDALRQRAANDLALVLLTRRKYREAMPLFEALVEARLREESPDSPALAQAEANLARTLHYLDRTEDAAVHLNRALDIYRRVLPAGHSTLATALLSMANLHFKTQNYAQARVVLDEALATNRQAYGEESAAVATILAAQSRLAEIQRDQDRAEQLGVAALEMRRRTLPADHPDIASSLRQLSSLHAARNEDDQALTLMRQALAIQRVHGASDYDACETLINLATFEFEHGDIDEAVRLAREGSDAMAALLGEQHESVLTSRGRVARFLEARGDYEEALKTRQAVLAHMRSMPDYEPARLAAQMDDVGAGLNRLGRFDEAQPLLLEGLEIRRRELGADHFATARSKIRLGACLTGLGRFAEAEPLLLEAEAVWVAHSRNSPQTLEAWEALANLYERWGRPDDAARWRELIAKRRPARPPANRPVPQQSQPASTSPDA